MKKVRLSLFACFFCIAGFKMDYGGHDSIFEFNLVISYPDHFSQNCVGFGSFFPGRGHTSRYNKCIVPHNDREGISLQHCRNSNAVLHDNEYYSPNGTLLVHCWDDDEGPVPFEEAQESFGIEKGSSIHNTPDQSDILLWSAELLLSEGILYKYE